MLKQHTQQSQIHTTGTGHSFDGRGAWFIPQQGILASARQGPTGPDMSAASWNLWDALHLDQGFPSYRW